MELGSRDVEEVLGARHGMWPERKIAFRGRLEHLRRLGCPPGLNTGKGRPAVFGWKQFIELSLALDFINLGMTPEHASRVIKDHQTSLKDALVSLPVRLGSREDLRQAAQIEKWPIDRTLFLLVGVNALAALETPGSADTPGLGIVEGRLINVWLRGASAHQSANVVVDLGTRIANLLLLTSRWGKRNVADITNDFFDWAEGNGP